MRRGENRNRRRARNGSGVNGRVDMTAATLMQKKKKNVSETILPYKTFAYTSYKPC